MRLFTRLTRSNNVPPTAAGLPPEPEPQLAEFDTLAAIEAHVAWKLKLQSYINGKGAPLDAEAVSSDCNCALGRWMHGNGAALYELHPTFRDAKLIHAEFHRCAGEIVRAVHAGDTARAQSILTSPEFLRYSEQIKKKLASIFLEFSF